MYIAQNLKNIRKRKGLSQEEMAQKLKLNRSTYSGYENEVAQPNLELLLLIAQSEHLPLESMLTTDLSKLTNAEYEALCSSWKQGATGQNLRVLTTIVNEDNEDTIELIPEKVRAGYTAGYSDPSYLQELPTLRLPFLSKDRKYRAFPIAGDSMPPVVHGSYVVGEFVQDWIGLPSSVPCVVVTKDDGIVFKYLHNHLKDKQSFTLASTNPLYAPYDVHVSEVLEIWRFVSYISKELPDVQLDHASIGAGLRNIQEELQKALQLRK
ncbi:MAG: helix-turn-helix domain-containing protein [Flavobacteriales bacterium]